MRTQRRWWLLGTAVLAVGTWLGAQNASTPKPLAEIVPSGALVYVEARDFGAVLSDWNNSSEKKTWLASANYRVFSRSRLFLRLQDVFQEYAGGVGIAPDMNLLASVAGGETAVAIYDISNLEALYVTRLSNARALESVLWKAKEKFSERRAGTQVYYAKTDPVSRRTASFAIAGDLLLLATREEALTGALGLLAGAAGAGTPVSREPWFAEAVQAQANAGSDIRLVANMESLVKGAPFRSYWIQNNVAELRPYRAAIADLTRSASEWREQRTLLRGEPLTAAPDASATPALLRMGAGGSPGLFEVWAQPGVEEVGAMVANRLLRPGPRTGLRSESAPGISLDPYAVGSEADLEAQLDEAPHDPPGAVFKLEPVNALFGRNRPVAMLLSQTMSTPQGSVFPSSDTVIAVQGSGAWNADTVRQALTSAVESLHTTNRIGVGWRERRVQNEAISEMDGLVPLAFVAKGPLLVIGTRAETVAAAVGRSAGAASGEAVVYAAGVRTTAADRATFTRLTRMIEYPGGIPATGDADAEPAFFSQNLASLARVFERAQDVRVTARDDGRTVRQTVVYRLAAQ